MSPLIIRQLGSTIRSIASLYLDLKINVDLSLQETC